MTTATATDLRHAPDTRFRSVPSFLTSTCMGLDCYPKPCPCPSHARKHDDSVPDGSVHRGNEPCPFSDAELPKGIFGSCCWLRGKVAARELDALGEDGLSERLYEDMTAEEAADFAKDLDRAATRLERAHAKDVSKPRGAGWN